MPERLLLVSIQARPYKLFEARSISVSRIGINTFRKPSVSSVTSVRAGTRVLTILRILTFVALGVGTQPKRRPERLLRARLPQRLAIGPDPTESSIP